MRRFAHLRNIPALVTLALVSLLLAACGASPATPAGIAVGAVAPEFTLSDSTGRQVALADYRGTSVLLFFHMALG
jgi:cytochrome oxidase Cu insertion factor (SCO1/SenC/PrrC family)